MTYVARRDGRPRPELIVIGGSAGALDPLCAIVAGLPPLVDLPIAIVLHIPRHRPSALASVIAHKVEREVAEPDDKEPAARSVVYVAPPDYHLLVDAGPSFSLSVDAPVSFSLPSIDVLFESAAATLGSRVAAVLLSGANDDGASGIAAVAKAGGHALVQSPETAANPWMPQAALAVAAGASALPVEGIGRRLRSVSVGEGG